MKYDAIVVASGKGERMQLGYNKVFLLLEDNRSVLEHSLSCFVDDDDCQKIVLVINEKTDFTNDKLVVCSGGEKRSDSVYNGLLKCESEYVMVHDGARPYLKKEDLNNLKQALINEDAAILAGVSTNTLKEVEDGYITKTIDRSKVYQALTPQACKREILLKAYKEKDINKEYTDEASLLEGLVKVKVVVGSSDNIKITYPSDIK